MIVIVESIQKVYDEGAQAERNRIVALLLREPPHELAVLAASYIVAAEGMGHNDAPLYDDLSVGGKAQYRKLGRQMLDDISRALADLIENLMPDPFPPSLDEQRARK